MRNGFSVRAKACTCHALFPKKSLRSTTCTLRLATLERFATFAVYSSTSPDRNGSPGSTGGSGALTLPGVGDAVVAIGGAAVVGAGVLAGAVGTFEASGPSAPGRSSACA